MQKNILEYLDYSSKNYPNKIAFSDGECSIRFSELKKIADSIGSHISNNHGTNEPIVVFMGRTPKSIAAYLGVVTSGNYYVPIDPDIPKDRIEHIFNTLTPSCIICSKETEGKLKEYSRHPSTYLYEEILREEVNEEKLKQIRGHMIDTDPLYIVYTSGSTGIPKGVIASHRSVIDYIDQLSEILQVSDETVFGNQTPLYLDACLKEVYTTLKHGSTAYIIPKKLFMFPVKLIEFMNTFKINTVCWVVSAFTIISSLNVLVNHIPKHLKSIAFGSEVFPIKQFNRWKNALPEARFINLYGPTEGTGMCCYYEVNRSFEKGDKIPIGNSFNNTDVFLLDDSNQKIINEDIVGELCIRGASLTHGYYKDFDKTDNAFIQNPLNTVYPEKIYKTGDLVKYNTYGELVFVSRKDHQIKHMGHRIELGEIEAAVHSIKDIQNACCVYKKRKKRIQLFYVGEIEKKEILKALESKLPKYMLPTRFKQLDKMPLTPNGKIDRVSLKEMK